MAQGPEEIPTMLSLKMCGSNAIGLSDLVKMSSGSVTQDEVLSRAKTIIRMPHS